MQVNGSIPEPPSDVERVVEEEIRSRLEDIYFLQRNARQHAAALTLRDAVLKLRRDGAFVAVPLFRVNTDPIGPHPTGSYEIWVPSESFASVYSYLCQHRGELSILVHPLTREENRDHEFRNSWMGPSFPLNLDTLSIRLEEIPLQYPLLKLGYSSIITPPSIEERKAAGRKIEEKLRGDRDAAPAPPTED
ncbi:DOPA 4,5-dioxygenase [Ceratobasidium sp. AG-Ba]|nr:DOPA 4,5-dioxygenase [Ceratobasidium sp. AG-Ba]